MNKREKYGMTKFKVFNNNDFTVGIRYEDSNREQNIMPNSRIMMEEDDIFYVDSVSKLFSKGVIFIQDQGMLENMGYSEPSPNSISETEIKDILKMGNAKMKNELKKLDADHAISKVIKVAREDGELTQTKQKIITDLFGDEASYALENDDAV